MTGRARFGFVLGTGRCGSTLAQELLCLHPEVGFLSNVEDRFRRSPVPTRASGPLYRRLPPSLGVKGRARFYPSEGYPLLRRQVSPLVAEPSRDLVAEDAMPWLAERFRRVFEGLAESSGAPVFVHKFTGWPRARFIDACLEGVRYVHVVRDGRAVASSLLQVGWFRGHLGPEGWGFGPLPPHHQESWERSGRSFAVLAGIWWLLLLDAFDAARAEIGDDRWLELRYEDVLAHPHDELGRAAGLLGLSPSPAFDRALAARELRGGRADAWRAELGPAAAAQLDALLGERLGALGYPV